MDIEIEQLTPRSWERYRALRLEALRDAPDAFGSTFESESRRSSEWWRERLAGDAASFLVKVDGRDAGIAVGAPYPGAEDAGLFAMYVAPRARGTGASDRLIEAVIAWARARRYRRLLLDVGDGNAAAIRLYERHGFVPTGVAGTLPPPRTHVREHQRALGLTDAPPPRP